MKHRQDRGRAEDTGAGGKRPAQHQFDEKPDRARRRQADQRDSPHQQADRRAADAEEPTGPQARTADSSPGDAPPEHSRSGSAPPDGAHAATRFKPDEKAGIETMAVAEPERGPLARRPWRWCWQPWSTPP